MKILFEMFHTESMVTVGEYAFDTFEEAFLAIRKEYETVFRLLLSEKFRCTDLDNFVKKAEKPQPIVIVLFADNTVCKGEQLPIGVSGGGGEKDAFVF